MLRFTDGVRVGVIVLPQAPSAFQRPLGPVVTVNHHDLFLVEC